MKVIGITSTADSALAAFPSWWSADIRASSTKAIGSVRSIPGPPTGGDDWYDNDDVYVSYENNGYYMYNRSYPGEGIAINITF